MPDKIYNHIKPKHLFEEELFPSDVLDSNFESKIDIEAILGIKTGGKNK